MNFGGNAASAAAERQVWGFQTHWVKRKYVVSGGWIQPFLGTGSEPTRYDPFDHYSPGSEDGSLHLWLLRLDLADEAEIERFVSSYGLLGLFQDQVVQLRHQIEIGTVKLDLCFSQDGRGSRVPGAAYPWDVKLEMLRRGLASVTVDGHYAIVPEFAAAPSAVEAEIANSIRDRDLERFARGSEPCGTALVQDGWALHEETSRVAYRYFTDGGSFVWQGDLAEGGAGRPASPWDWKMWDFLAEPLDEFRAAVCEFRLIFRECQEVTTGEATPERALEAGERLSQHLRRIHPVAKYDAITQEWVDAWSFPSLLSVCYKMLHQDLAEHLHVGFCRRCRNPLTGHRRGKKYCSRSCLDAFKQAEYRRLRKQETQENTK